MGNSDYRIEEVLDFVRAEADDQSTLEDVRLSQLPEQIADEIMRQFDFVHFAGGREDIVQLLREEIDIQPEPENVLTFLREVTTRVASSLLVDRYIASSADITDAEALRESLETGQRQYALVLTQAGIDEGVLQALQSDGYEFEPIDWCPDAYLITNKVGKSKQQRLKRLRQEGKIMRLSPQAMLAVSSALSLGLADTKSAEILEMCAGKGTKTPLLTKFAHPTAHIVSNDPHNKRRGELDADAKAGNWNVDVQGHDGQHFGSNEANTYDYVFIDAPCTGTGDIERKPKQLQLNNPKYVAKMAQLQQELLFAGIKTAKPGAHIVYSTCSTNPEENEQVIHAALQEFGDEVEVVEVQQGSSEDENEWNLDQAKQDARSVQESLALEPAVSALRMWPHTYGGIGFFVCVLKKKQ